MGLCRRASQLTALSVACLLAGCGWITDEDEEQAGSDLPAPMSIDQALGELPESTPAALTVGDYFPLKKTVVQELKQRDSQSRSKLELWFQIGVVDLQHELTKLQVKYLDVRYEHEIAGQTVVFDSRSMSAVSTPETNMYRGMVNNGFSFWVDSDQQLVRVDEDFDDFLRTCLADVSETQRQAVMLSYADPNGRLQISSFVDASVGMLPAGEVREMRQWTQRRMLAQPAPVQFDVSCTLSSLKDKSAKVEVFGTLPPGTPQPLYLYGKSSPAIQMQVAGGHCHGQYTLDRETGLPLQSQNELVLDLIVELPDGLQFAQQKTIRTTIDTYSESDSRTSFPPAEVGTIPPAKATPGEIPSAQY